MRNLHADEQATLRSGHCVFCRYELFHLGPQGGLSFNIYCGFRHCRAGFNVSHEKLPWQLIAMPGDVTADDLSILLRGTPPPMNLKDLLERLSAVIEKSMRDALEKYRPR